MPRMLCPLLVLFLAAAAVSGRSTFAQSVWSGYGYSFTKAEFSSPLLPENQDRITDHVWLTRQVNQGIFNIHDETSYGSFVSPGGTRWATDLNNPGETIEATNWNNLSFTVWVDAYGGQGTMGLPARLLGHNAVVYLVEDNTYLDLRFTGWSVSGGGGFSYDRSPAPLLPPTTGDYNQNGVVDAADYIVWRETLTQAADPAGSGADGNANGTIEVGDYTFWRERFGDIVPLGAGAGAAGFVSASAAVPEPTVIMLVVIGLLSFPLFRGRRKSIGQ